MVRTRLAALAISLVAALTLAGCGDDEVTVSEAGSERAADHRFLIPPGTGEAMDRGEPVEILPAELAVQVGEVLELVNEDDRGHLVGPFFVGAGETLRQEFTSPGTFEGICTVHPSGQFVLTVT